MKSVFFAALLPLSVLAGPVSISFITGYGLPFPAQNLTSNTSANYTTSPSSMSIEMVSGSYADGLRIGTELGIAVNEWMTLGIGFRYEKSSEIAQSSTTVDVDNQSESQRKSLATSLSGIPSLIIAAPGQTLRPFVRLNGRIATSSILNQYDYQTTSPSGTDIQYDFETSGGLSIGFGGGVGVEYKISDRISLLGEMLADSWTYNPTDGKYTKYLSNGVDVLSTRTVAQNHIQYLDSYTNSGTEDPNSPSKQAAFSRNYSAVALNLGLKFQF